jgi:hypothetical protein
MNILILAANYEQYQSGYYHHDWIRAFTRKGSCCLYGKGYPNYNINDSIEDVIAKSPFAEREIDLIVVSTSWEVQAPSVPESDPHPNINLAHLDIPRVFFLNKEYKKLDAKLRYAKKNRFDLVCTVHHDYEQWAKKTGLRFLHVPFAADPQRFEDFGLPKKYDFGFTGSLHTKWINTRCQIKELLFQDPTVKSNLGIERFLRQNSLRPEFQKYKIYWAEWGARDILGRSLVPHGERYARLLNGSRSFLCTPSAIGIINTRYFECMATKTLVLCPKSDYYQGLFKDGHNCLMFDEDLSDFAAKLQHASSESEETKSIVDNAYEEFHRLHTYDRRVESVLRELNLM